MLPLLLMYTMRVIDAYNLALEVYFSSKGLPVSAERAGLAHMMKRTPTITTLLFADALKYKAVCVISAVPCSLYHCELYWDVMGAPTGPRRLPWVYHEAPQKLITLFHGTPGVSHRIPLDAK